MLLRFFILILGMFCFAYSSYGQGPFDGFFKGKGNADIALTYSHEHYDTYYFGREKQDLPVTVQSLNLFATGGINADTDWVVSLPYMWIDSTNRSIQDAIVAVKYRNKSIRKTRGFLDLITAVGVSFPAGTYEAGPLGLRAVSFQPRFMVQYKDDLGFFINAQTGLDFRMVPSSQFAIPFITRLGFAGRKIYFDVWFDYFSTIEPGVDTQIGAGEGAVWAKIGGTIYTPIGKHFGAFVGMAQFLTGRNIGRATRFNVGIVGKI